MPWVTICLVSDLFESRGSQFFFFFFHSVYICTPEDGLVLRNIYRVKHLIFYLVKPTKYFIFLIKILPIFISKLSTNWTNLQNFNQPIYISGQPRKILQISNSLTFEITCQFSLPKEGCLSIMCPLWSVVNKNGELTRGWKLLYFRIIC